MGERLRVCRSFYLCIAFGMLLAMPLKADDPETRSRVFVLTDISNEPDALRQSWFVYSEAGTITEEVTLGNDGGEQTALVVPPVEKPATIHVILQVEDDGNPSLVAYRRAIIKIEPHLPQHR